MNRFDFRDAPQEPRPPRANGVNHLIFSITILIAMLIYEQSAVAAIVASGLVYGLASGTFADLVVVWRLTQVEQATPLPEPARILPEPVRMLPETTRTFVSPVDDSTRSAALAFVAQLYTSDGALDAQKVSLATGRVRCTMPGKPATEYLITRGLLRQAEKDGHQNGWLFSAAALPRRHLALNRI